MLPASVIKSFFQLNKFFLTESLDAPFLETSNRNFYLDNQFVVGLTVIYPRNLDLVNRRFNFACLSNAGNCFFWLVFFLLNVILI